MSARPDPIHVVRNGAILEITLDRPKANAIDQPTSRRMGEVFAAFRDDPALRVAILTGGGARFFSAGWDLSEAAVIGGDGYGADYGQGGLYGFAELDGLTKPVICAVNGYAVGAGFEITLLADFVIAAEGAQFWLPETQLGIVPDVGSFLLPQILPPAIAHEILYGGLRLSAGDAARWGLVNRVTPPEALMDSARELAARVIRSAPLAVAAVRETARLARHMPLAEAYATMRRGGFPAMARALGSADAAEGPRAAPDKRPPLWTGN